MIVGSARERRLWNVATYAIAGFFGLTALGPIVWLVLTSLKTEADIVTAQGVVYWPSTLTLANYRELWDQTDFPTLFRNSLSATTLTVVICLVVGTLAAYALSREAFRGRQPLLMGLLAIRMFPAVMQIIPLFIIMKAIGLLDTKLGLALAYASFLLPMFIWLMKGFFDDLPGELEEAARIDGCSRLGAMWRIALPVARNGLLATTVLIAISAWNEFLFALMLTTGADTRTWPVGLQLMIGDFQLPWGLLAAGGVISIIPVVVLFAFVQGSMVRGLTEGATKG
jgi:multiple sugar transport system permease protein